MSEMKIEQTQRHCATCRHFSIGVDGGSTSRDGKTFGLCDRAAYEEYVRTGSWQYGTVYHDRALLYVMPTFGCIEHTAWLKIA